MDTLALCLACNGSSVPNVSLHCPPSLLSHVFPQIHFYSFNSCISFSSSSSSSSLPLLVDLKVFWSKSFQIFLPLFLTVLNVDRLYFSLLLFSRILFSSLSLVFKKTPATQVSDWFTSPLKTCNRLCYLSHVTFSQDIKQFHVIPLTLCWITPVYLFLCKILVGMNLLTN